MIGFFAAQAMSRGPRLWTPSHLEDPPKVWLDWVSGINEVGGAAAAWIDRSGSGWDFEQPSNARRPAIVESGINGKRVLSFDGGNDALLNLGEGADIFRNTGAGWALTVYKKRTSDTPSDSACVFYTNVASGVTNTNRFNVIASRAATPGFGAFATRRLLDATAIIGRTASDVGEWVMRLDAADWANGDAYLWANGILDGSNTTTMTSGPTSDIPGPGLYIGAGGHSGNYTNSHSDIDLACVIAGSGTLPSEDEIDRLFGWAAWQLGLQGNLPMGHPYKDAPPIA